MTFNLDWSIDKLILDREEICQDCQLWICITNCRNCLYDALLDYKPFNSFYLND